MPAQSGGVSEADAASLANGIHLAYLGTLLTWSAGAGDDAAALGRSLHDTIAHVRARFLRSEFWINCLGMLGLSTLAALFSFALQ